MPHRQIKKLDRTLFCHPKRDYETAAEILKLLPNIKSIKSSITDLEYESHISSFGVEQLKFFTELGDRYQITGVRGGTDRQCIYAQSVVLHYIMLMEEDDPVRYWNLFRAFKEGYRRRAKLEQFRLTNDLTLPRLPSIKVGVNQLNELVEKKEIMVGQSQESHKISAVTPVSCEKIEISVDMRKNSFDELREFTLHKHKKYLRAKEPAHYQNLEKNSILQMLKEYGIHDLSHDNMEENELQNLLRNIESTREIAIWYDHSAIANHSHVLFTFQVIYNHATYVCPHGMDVDDMQKDIETPLVYMLGMSKSTTAAERSYDELRLLDVLSLSTPKSINGVVFKDIFRVTFGDNPVRCSESGQNKSGSYHVCSLPLHINKFHSYRDLLCNEHLTISDKRAIASKGNYFDSCSGENLNFNLQDVNSREYCTRSSIPFTDAKDAAIKHEQALCGVKSMPAMLSQHPYTELSLINLKNWMVFPLEVLHDVKGVLKKSFANIPGSIHITDPDILKSIHGIVHKTGDELYLLKDKHSAESLAKALVDICSDLEDKFFPFGLSEPCRDCGHLLTISTIEKCLKCSIVGYYRVLCEIQLYAYKHQSKRNSYEVVRLHNLTFLLFYFLDSIEKVLPRFDRESMIRCSYFVNVVYYLGIAFELHNSISFNAGRNEDMFRLLKNIVRNFTNHQMASPLLLLHTIRRLEASRYYNGTNFTNGSSQYSKKISYFLKKKPRPDISYSKDFIESSLDFPLLVQRLSTFLVSNTSDRYVCSKQNLLVFSYKSCNCSSNECLVCQGKIFPSFGMNNILFSSFEKILNTKAFVYSSKFENNVVDSNGKVIFKELQAILSCQTTDEIVLAPARLKLSERILSKVSIDNVSDAQINLPKTFKTILEKLPDIQHKDFKLLKNSFQVKCLAKIYGTVDSELIVFDRICGSLESIQKQHANCPEKLRDSPSYYEAHKKYITFVRKHIHKLNSFVSCLKDQIATCSVEVDQLYFTNVNDDELSLAMNTELENSFTKKSAKILASLQKRLLAYQYAVHSLHLESNAHMYMETEFDDGLF